MGSNVSNSAVEPPVFRKNNCYKGEKFTENIQFHNIKSGLASRAARPSCASTNKWSYNNYI